jgi:L,D-peptidoglycan transpeptidase YkuD (ErfK/YbiS/YcfS/YnhG family)
MHNVPAYRYAAVIAYNRARTPGAGSAIFLHVETVRPREDVSHFPRPTC